MEPDGYLIAFEAVMTILLIICFRHAIRIGGWMALQLLAGVVFGVLLEWATIQQLEAYHYGRFLIMIDNVPLMIGVGWGVIIYSVRHFSDSTDLPVWVRPVLDGLLALNIDLAMDTIAIRLGMWDWGFSLQKGYFGVPYANFWAWFWVVVSFSAAIRFLAKKPTWAGKWLAPFGAIAVGVIGVVGTNALITFVIPDPWYETTVVLTLVAALLLVLFTRPRFYRRPVDRLVFWVPLGFHAFFLTAGVASTAILNPPLLLLPSILMLLIALYLHHPTIKSLLNRPARL